MRILAALLTALTLIAPSLSLADWQDEKRAFDEYKVAKAAVEQLEGTARAEAYVNLAEHPHATRPENGWVRAWCLQNAAYAYHLAGDEANATTFAGHAIDQPGALKETRAKAHTILAHWLAAKGKDTWAAALGHYESALELDPNLTSAQRGKATLEKALRKSAARS